MILYRDALAQPRGNDVEVVRLAAIRQFQLCRCQLAVFLPADRPDPFSRIDQHSGDTPLGILLGMGKAYELDLLHVPIYSLQVVNCQVRPFLLKVL